MWMRIRAAIKDIWRRLERGGKERRTADARARFWAGVREGEREAEARSRR